VIQVGRQEGAVVGTAVNAPSSPDGVKPAFSQKPLATPLRPVGT
jgi:hypothetical protein